MEIHFFYFPSNSIIGNNIDLAILALTTARREPLIVLVQLGVLAGADHLARYRGAARRVSPLHSTVLLTNANERCLCKSISVAAGECLPGTRL